MPPSPTILLLTPPFVQVNAPYPAVPVLTAYLRGRGHRVIQRDLSLEAALRVFSPDTIRLAASSAQKGASEEMDFFLDAADDYAATIKPVLAFLQGRAPELAWRIARRLVLPEGPHFQELVQNEEMTAEDYLAAHFGLAGLTDQAKYLASLYLDDLALFLKQSLDPDFGFGKYAERLALSLTTLDPLLQRLDRTTAIDRLIDDLAAAAIDEAKPEYIGLAIPFPGTLYGALRIARQTRRLAPQAAIILGGGYVNSELRQISDTRIFQFADFLAFDEGFRPLAAIVEKRLIPDDGKDGCPSGSVMSAEGRLTPDPRIPVPAVVAPDYGGLRLDDYVSVTERTNPMHRLWSDGLWLKMQLARGCYWHRCAFCDLSLDYIGRYEPSPVKDIVDAMERLIAETGRRGFHFVDEAAAPALLAELSREILRRKLVVSWWGNIRFEKTFTRELAQLMADAGCIAVTGGLECANDRLLALMNKGISCASAHTVLRNLAEAGLMIHAYLMYAFPTETRQEAIDALEYVRRCFRDGLVHSAFWHRFALTAHSYIAAHPDEFHIRLMPEAKGPRFARNEIPYEDDGEVDWDDVGRRLATAVSNYEMGLGLDLPASRWFRR